MKINAIYASREPNRAAVLIEALSASQFAVSVAQKSKEVLGQLSKQNASLLLIGEKLLDCDGVSFVKNLRAKGAYKQMPVVAVVEHGEAQAAAPQRSAYAAFGKKPVDAIRVKFSGEGASNGVTASVSSQASIRLAFFNAGADECLSLNWDAAECVARIKALLRRTQTAPSEENKIEKTGLTATNRDSPAIETPTISIAGRWAAKPMAAQITPTTTPVGIMG